MQTLGHRLMARGAVDSQPGAAAGAGFWTGRCVEGDQGHDRTDVQRREHPNHGAEVHTGHGYHRTRSARPLPHQGRQENLRYSCGLAVAVAVVF